MKVTITATAPTIYQRTSIGYFGIEVTAHKDGSFSASKTFDSKEEAEAYLKERANLYLEDEQENVEDKRELWHTQIEMYGMLTLDASTARILEFYEEK